MTLYWYVLALMASLAPSENAVYRHGRLASAIAIGLDAEAPLYSNDDSRHRTAALLVAVAYRESGLNPMATGDNGRSFGAFQNHASSGGSPVLLEDTEQSVRRALSMLRQSIRIDRANPVSWYARGPRYQSEEARRISRDRVRLAEKLAR